ncbi:unnamed protein product [Nesidiocoris tenuis]|uniref:Uncharacterized protein n=1 Tax=Nesidiocoris tenuis TaxID=355587 RepID=A0A6H5H2E8_9HEMI|nr:unnamed protein product [Nesidiocoris tenuis]
MKSSFSRIRSRSELVNSTYALQPSRYPSAMLLNRLHSLVAMPCHAQSSVHETSLRILTNTHKHFRTHVTHMCSLNKFRKFLEQRRSKEGALLTIRGNAITQGKAKISRPRTLKSVHFCGRKKMENAKNANISEVLRCTSQENLLNARFFFFEIGPLLLCVLLLTAYGVRRTAYGVRRTADGQKIFIADSCSRTSETRGCHLCLLSTTPFSLLTPQQRRTDFRVRIPDQVSSSSCRSTKYPRGFCACVEFLLRKRPFREPFELEKRRLGCVDSVDFFALRHNRTYPRRHGIQ